MRRPRGPGGRFLTQEEIAAQQKAAESADPSKTPMNPNPSAEERKALKASSSDSTSNAPAEPSNATSSSITTGSVAFSTTGTLANSGSANGAFIESSSGLAQENYPSTDNVQQFLNMANDTTTNDNL